MEGRGDGGESHRLRPAEFVQLGVVADVTDPPNMPGFGGLRLYLGDRPPRPAGSRLTGLPDHLRHPDRVAASSGETTARSKFRKGAILKTGLKSIVAGQARVRRNLSAALPLPAALIQTFLSLRKEHEARRRNGPPQCTSDCWRQRPLTPDEIVVQ